METITSIPQLITRFENADSRKQVEVLKNIDIPIADFEVYCSWKDDDYTRNCIARKKTFEFILLCWNPGALTPLHNHDDQDCWVYQVSGTVLEKRFKETEKGFEITNEQNLGAGKITYMHDRMGYHTIENVSSERAMTLHVYANPIDRCKVYNDATERFEIREMQYDTVMGKVGASI